MNQFAVIGDPIVHSLSPILHGEIYRQLGMDASYEKIHILPNQLTDFMSRNRLEGFNVTIPHKTSIIPFLTQLSDSAKTIGAVNCVSGSKGINTDWTGFIKALELHDLNATGKNSIILGAGGGARAVAFALIKSKANSITIVNRTKVKAEKLVRWVKSYSSIEVHSLSPKQFNTSAPQRSNTLFHEYMIINCTPLGMWPNTKLIPMNMNWINPSHILIDTIYNPIKTKWLIYGGEKGAKVIEGLDMFIFQGLASADYWFNESISEKVNLKKLTQTLIAAI